MDSFVGDVALTAERIDELIRWHGTDEGSLPPAHTLAHLGRDTVAAMHELLSAIPGVRCLPPEGAFYCFPSFVDLLGRDLGGRSAATTSGGPIIQPTRQPVMA